MKRQNEGGGFHDHGEGIHNALRAMPEADRFDAAADSFRLLGDASRLRIFWLLCHCEECVSNIAAAVGMSDAAASHHLRALRQNGLLASRRVGKEIHYSLADDDRARLAHRMLDDIFRLTCPGGG